MRATGVSITIKETEWIIMRGLAIQDTRLCHSAVTHIIPTVIIIMINLVSPAILMYKVSLH